MALFENGDIRVIFFLAKTQSTNCRVKSLGGHFACLCWGFGFYEVKKKMLLFFKMKMEIFLHFLSFLW